MEKNSTLMFIGEIISNQDIRITRRPSIYDAFLLSDKSLPVDLSPMKESYQSIPLVEHANISIHFKNYQIELSYQFHSLQITETSKTLSEEEVLEVFTNFFVRVGDQVNYLGTSPYCKTRSRKKKKERILGVEKKLQASRN